MKKFTKKLDNIFLIGPMGAGKTVIGSHLAELLDKKFYDVDHEVESQTKKTITNIFQEEGKSKFREYESQMISVLTNLDNIVLSTGGGAILNTENRKHLFANGLVIYLKVSVAEQLSRLKETQDRPLLQITDPEAKLKELAKQRESFYHDLADHMIVTDHRTIDSVVDEIIRLYRR